MPRTRTGRQDTSVVTAHGAFVTPAWTSRWQAACPAMPRTSEEMADQRANRRVLSLTAGLLVSQARSANAA